MRIRVEFWRWYLESLAERKELKPGSLMGEQTWAELRKGGAGHMNIGIEIPVVE